MSDIRPTEVDSLSSAQKTTIDDKNDTANGPSEYPPFRTVMAIMAALYIAMFLVSLDRIIISTAIPRITDEFQSLQDVGWYGSAYVLSSCAMQLLFGRLYAFFHNKTVFIAAIVLFEVGSVLCGAAPNSTGFILGRALAGAGAAGVFAGVIVVMISLVPLDKRPAYQGLLGAIFGVSSVVGPLIGGAFTNNTHLTWRWCFYINLPVGAVSVALVLALLQTKPPQSAGLPALAKARRLDPLGTLLFTSAVVSLLLALAWGGSTYAWSSVRVVTLLVLFGVLFPAWIVVEVRLGEDATVPRRLLQQRSVLAGVGFSMCIGGVMLALCYYMAIWFQAVQGVDALQSGIRSLPFVLALVVASIVAGAGVGRLGYYTPFAMASACLMAVGLGLLTTLRVDSSRGAWIGFQVLAGFGMGLGMQMAGLAAQTVLAPLDIPVGAALMFFGQGFGGSVFLSATQNVFLQSLVQELSAVLPASSAEVIASIGATGLRTSVPTEQLPVVLVAYNRAITKSFYVPLALACVGIIPALCLEWKSVKGKKGMKETEKGDNSMKANV